MARGMAGGVVRTTMICKCQRCVSVTLKENELHERGVKNVCLFDALNFFIILDMTKRIVWLDGECI